MESLRLCMLRFVIHREGCATHHTAGIRLGLCRTIPCPHSRLHHHHGRTQVRQLASHCTPHFDSELILCSAASPYSMTPHLGTRLFALLDLTSPLSSRTTRYSSILEHNDALGYSIIQPCSPNSTRALVILDEHPHPVFSVMTVLDPFVPLKTQIRLLRGAPDEKGREIVVGSFE
jgi:hypothetical protein